MKALASLLLLAGSAVAAPVAYTLPQDTVGFAPGPNVDLVSGNCGVCHSADYVITQPRNGAGARAFWQAEVVKMKAAYGAPLADDDIPKIVDYLAATYGK